MKKKRCECGQSRPSFGPVGLPGKDARWCANCPGKPADAVNAQNRRCECGQSEPSFGLPEDDRKSARWCSKCPTKPEEAINVKKKQGQEAQIKQAKIKQLENHLNQAAPAPQAAPASLSMEGTVAGLGPQGTDAGMMSAAVGGLLSEPFGHQIPVMAPMPPPLAAAPPSSASASSKSRQCECGKHRPSFGLPGQGGREARWCATCPTKPLDAVNVQNRRCECKQSEPSFGPPGGNRKDARWCAKCPDLPADAINVKRHGANAGQKRAREAAAAASVAGMQGINVAAVVPGWEAHVQKQPGVSDSQAMIGLLVGGVRMEAPGVTGSLPPISGPLPPPLATTNPMSASYGLDGAGDPNGFASALELGTIPMSTMMTSDLMVESLAAAPQQHLQQQVAAAPQKAPTGKQCECGHHRPSFGPPGSSSREARWCATCPSKPPDAVNVKNRRCECGQSEPSFGMPDEDRKSARWCSKCPGKHPEAVNVKKKQAAQAAALKIAPHHDTTL